MQEPSHRAVELAAELLRAAKMSQLPLEAKQSARLARLMDDPAGKEFTLSMVDQVFRSTRPAQQARRFRDILQNIGVPRYLPLLDRLLLRLAALASRATPGLAMSAVRSRLRRDSAAVILAGESQPLADYLATRRSAGTRVNLNQLGEAILGEEEAARRMAAIIAHLNNPAVDYISIKISAIFSQINLLDWDGTLNAIKGRLRQLYRVALPQKKFVNLDMEEYRDLQMTVSVFTSVLDEPEFMPLRAGMVLQAYLPDSWGEQQKLIEWAKARVARGGAPAKLRLVKGANRAMEAVDAELHGWYPAPYATKHETDANFKRMLEFGCLRENAVALNLGVASHNLFDIALALVLRQQNGVAEHVELEMLEGMANQQARAVQKVAGGLIVYAPVVKQEDFNSAIAYLVRRLDENTAPQSFLRDLFGLDVGTPAWNRQRDAFLAAWADRASVSAISRRNEPAEAGKGFSNIADTDWTQSIARQAFERAMAGWKVPSVPEPIELENLLSTASHAQPAWEALGYSRRGELLQKAAEVMQHHRFETIACMVHDGKKAPAEADAEVSEAIDFANYYGRILDPASMALAAPPSAPVSVTALGVVVITPPWNFPYAIPCGGVLAALMAGNCVILKPAPQTVLTAWALVNHLWEAGIPWDVLQFFPIADGEIGQALIIDPRVAAVVLTGSYETARMFLQWRPSLKLFAETSGKNAIVITAQADRDLAIKDLVKSAFGHSGQKCSAASLGILEAEVYDDTAFRRQLRDAASSLSVGPSTSSGNIITPLIDPPGAALHRALTQLDEGESWLLQPKQIGDDPCLWSPGIKLGVRRGSWFQRTECFGPVLGLIRAEHFEEAIAIQNDSQFGLTAGLHSLDSHEIAQWEQTVQAGNAYVNRVITGAVVQRQPFGGWKGSSLGPGNKAGGPNYVYLFSRMTHDGPTDLDRAAMSFQMAWHDYFSTSHDPSRLIAESNVLRYRPCRGVILRIEAGDEGQLKLARLAANTCGVPLEVSFTGEESDTALAARLPMLAAGNEFLRTIRPPSDSLLSAAYAAGIQWIDGPILTDGRLELLRWLREQAVSRTRHRYGQVSPLSGRLGHAVGTDLAEVPRQK